MNLMLKGINKLLQTKVSANLFKEDKKGVLECFWVTVDRWRVNMNLSSSIKPDCMTRICRARRLLKAAESCCDNAMFTSSYIGV